MFGTQLKILQGKLGYKPFQSKYICYYLYNAFYKQWDINSLKIVDLPFKQ